MNVDLGLFVLRVVVGAVIAAHGLTKVGWFGSGSSITGVAGFFRGLGFRPSLFWAYVATLAEVAGGVLMILGLFGPLAPGVVAADLVVVTIVAHWPKGFWVSQGGIEFPLPLAAGAFAVALIGNGRWSLDSVFGLTYPTWLAPTWAVLMVIGVGLALLSRAVSGAQPKAKSG